MTIEKTLEGIFIDALEKDTYVSQQKTPVMPFADNSEKHKAAAIVVKVTAVPEPMHPLYKASVEFMAVTHVAADADAAILESLYEACSGSLANIADDDEQGIIFHSNEINQPAEMTLEQDFQIKVFKFDCFFQVTEIQATTTTTTAK